MLLWTGVGARQRPEGESNLLHKHARVLDVFKSPRQSVAVYFNGVYTHSIVLLGLTKLSQVRFFEGANRKGDMLRGRGVGHLEGTDLFTRILGVDFLNKVALATK